MAMKPRTLLVDDDPNVFSALKRQLRSGFDVHTDTDPKITYKYQAVLVLIGNIWIQPTA